MDVTAGFVTSKYEASVQALADKSFTEKKKFRDEEFQDKLKILKTFSFNTLNEWMKIKLNKPSISHNDCEKAAIKSSPNLTNLPKNQIQDQQNLLNVFQDNFQSLKNFLQYFQPKL